MADVVHTPATTANAQRSVFDTQVSPKDLKTERDRDSGVFVTDFEEIQHSSRPASISGPTTYRQRTASTSSLTRSDSARTASTSSLTRTDSARTDRRLRRPAELNLGKQEPSDPSKGKSELELRYDLIRNSQTQSKATLKSPTQLLKDRLNLSPKKEAHERIRIFTPPKPMLNGCILPGPAAQIEAFTGKDVRAWTESGKAAWWCKFDKLVVFDGVDESSANGEDVIFKTRSSKGLSIARRRGDCETVVIPLDCAHCHEMLNRSEWKYDIQVCKRSVCWDCKERCRWEMNNAREEYRPKQLRTLIDRETNRVRADSVLRDEEQEQEEDLYRKVGIETVMLPSTPVNLV